MSGDWLRSRGAYYSGKGKHPLCNNCKITTRPPLQSVYCFLLLGVVAPRNTNTTPVESQRIAFIAACASLCGVILHTKARSGCCDSRGRKSLAGARFRVSYGRLLVRPMVHAAANNWAIFIPKKNNPPRPNRTVDPPT